MLHPCTLALPFVLSPQLPLPCTRSSPQHGSTPSTPSPVLSLLLPSSRGDPCRAAVTRTELRPARDPDFSVPPKLQCIGMKLAFSVLLIYLNFNDMVKVAKLHCLTGPKAVRAFC